MTLRKHPKGKITADTMVYDTPSGMGGTFTVQVIESDGDRRLVQTLYGTIDRTTGRYVQWDDVLEFWTTADQLTNYRTFMQRREVAA